MSRGTVLAVAGLLSLALNARAQDADDIVRRLQKRYDGIRDLTVAFTQTVRYGVTQATQTFEGRLWMKKGNRYRIELEGQTIVTDGKSVWTYSELNKQVLIDNYREDPRSFTPDCALANAPKDYYSTLIEKEKLGGTEVSVVKLVPKDDKSILRSMKIWVNPSDWLMAKVETLDVSDNVTTYVTKETKVNSGLSDTLFRFETPPGVETVDLRSSPQSVPR
jgi:chaperone LolA